MKQVKIPSWFGAIQVQLINSFFYLGLLNSVMLSITLWATAGPSVQQVLPWANYWLFLLIGLTLVITVMLLDYKFMYPTRTAFLNIQSCKHTNPAMQEILSISKRLTDMETQVNRIEKAIGGENIEKTTKGTAISPGSGN